MSLDTRHSPRPFGSWAAPLALATLLSTGAGCATLQANMGAGNAYKEGVAHLEEGDADAALASFESGLALESTSAESNGHLHAGMSQAYLRQYRLDAAVAEAEMAVEIKSDSTTLIALSQAMLLNRDSQGAFDAAKAAVEHCNVVAGANPDLAKRCYADGYLALGEVVRAVGQYDYANEQFDAAGGAGAAESTVLGEKAQVLNLQGDPAKGLAMAKQALAKNPESESGMLARGTAEAIQGDTAASRDTLEPILKKNPIAALEFLRVARGFVDQGKYDQAMVMYEMVTDIQPSNPYLWMDLGYVYQQVGNKKQSAVAYEKVLQVHKEMKPYTHTETTAAFKEKLEADLADGTLAADQVVFLVVAYTNIGNARYGLGDIDGAREAYQRVLAADPSDLSVTVILAGMMTDEAYQDELIAMLESAAKQAQANRASLEAADLMNAEDKEAALTDLNRLEADIEKRLGVTLYNLGRQDEAAPHLARAVELAPDDPNIRVGLGLSLFNEERFEEAIPHLEVALENNPGDYGILFSLGVAYRRTGNNAKAVKLLEEAKKLSPRNKDIYLELYYAYKALGKTKLARDHQKMYNSLP